MFPSSLFVYDFDGTVARTFETGSLEIDVEESYRKAIQDILGENGLGLYESVGGLQNRASGDLLLAMAEVVDSRSTFFKHFELFYEQQREMLQNLVPEGKGFDFDKQSSDQLLFFAAEVLTRQKLHYLLRQLGEAMPDGSRWPRMCEGFGDFWEYLCEIKDEYSINTAVVSSGHDEFIRRTFLMWDIPQPDILVSDDDVRRLEIPKAMKMRVKPGPLPMQLVFQQYFARLGGYEPGTVIAPFLHNRLVLFGDSASKDGGMAKAALAPFGLYNEDLTHRWQSHELGVQFNDWKVIQEWIVSVRDELRDTGIPVTELFYREFGRERRRLGKSCERG